MKIVSNALDNKISDTLLLRALILFTRKAISVESDELIETVVKLGFIPKLGALLDHNFDATVFLESSRILGNIAATTHENVLMMLHEGVHEKLIQGTAGEDPKIKEQVLFRI